MTDTRPNPIISELILIRHGETDSNAAGRLQGHLPIPLNDKGIGQARALQPRLLALQPEIVYTSDLVRARQTAEIAIGEATVPILLEPALRERNMGILQGLTYSQITRQFPEIADRFLAGDPDYRILNGESVRDLSERSIAAIERIIAAHLGGRVAVITHGGVLNVFLRFVLQIPLGAHVKFKRRNTSINIFEKRDQQWVLRLWGDACHLNEAEAPYSADKAHLAIIN